MPGRGREVARRRARARAGDRQHGDGDRPGRGRRGRRRRRAAADAAVPHRGQPGRPGRARQPGLPGHRPRRHRLQPRQRRPHRRDRRDARRPQPDPDRLQGRRRQHRADDPHLRPGRRPADLHRRPAHGGDLRAAAAAAGRQHLLLARCSTSCPQWALEFYDAVRAQDRDEVYRRLNEFVIPYLDIRDRTAGYAVSIVKGGLPPSAAGRPGPPAADRPARRARSPSSAT